MLLLFGVNLRTLAEPATRDAKFEFNIPQQRADLAVTEFAEQADLTLIIPSRLVRDKSANELIGTYTLQEGIEKLLAGTGLAPSFSNPVVLSIAIDDTVTDGGDMNKFKNAQLATAASAILAAAGVSAQSTANDDGSESNDDVVVQMDEIIVTGTNIRGVENPTSQVLQYDREDIELTGAATVQEFVRTLPQNFSSQIPTVSDSASDFGDFSPTSSSSIDLRGLGVGSTLTLVNGRRLAPSNLGNAVDVSVIPLAAIERVDVLTDGASAIYGSDAVGGVVNFITRRDYEGIEINGNYGTVTDGSQEQYSFGLSGGHGWGSGGFMLGASFTDTTPLNANERDSIDLSLAVDGTIDSATETTSFFTSVNQDLTNRLNVAVDAFHSKRDAEYISSRGTSFGNVTRFVASELDAIFVGTSLNYAFSEKTQASLFVDFGEDTTFGEVTQLGLSSQIDFGNKVTTVEGQISGRLMELSSGQALSYAVGVSWREQEFSLTQFGMLD